MFKELFGGGKSSTLLQAAFDDVTTMLNQGGKMLDHALAWLLDNEPLTVDLDDMDDVIDNGERMVRRTVMQHLSINPQQDMVASLILVSIVQDAERIGDFARGLGELKELTQSPLTGPALDDLRKIAGRVRPLFESCERAFREDDLEGAQKVVSAHVEIKSELAQYVRQVASSDLATDQAIVCALSARILRRVSAHLSNIASTVTQPYDQIRHGDEST